MQALQADEGKGEGLSETLQRLPRTQTLQKTSPKHHQDPVTDKEGDCYQKSETDED